MPPPPPSLFAHVLRGAGSFVRTLPGCHAPTAPDAPQPPKPSPANPERHRQPAAHPQPDLFQLWLASRRAPNEPLSPGAHRSFSSQNITLASTLVRTCSAEILSQLWNMHPYRISLMISLDFLRGILPAYRGYSQALMLQKLILSGEFTLAPIIYQVSSELIRMAGDSALDFFATSNENIVHDAARFLVERRQMEQRLRLDIPTLADPHVRDLLQESDMFVRSFNGLSAFGLFSPFDFLRLLTLISELSTHLWVLCSLTFGGRTPYHVIMLSLALSALPTILSWFSGQSRYWDCPVSQREVKLAAKQEAMRRLAHSDSYRPEVLLFDLGPWILDAWSRSRRTLMNLERRKTGTHGDWSSRIASQFYLSGMLSAINNVPLLLVLHSTSTSIGSFTLYRSTLQSLFVATEALLYTLRMAFQGIFLMGAFCAASTLKPRLQPEAKMHLPYHPSGRGMSIDVRNLSYTYPGCPQPALRNVSLSIAAGETVAIAKPRSPTSSSASSTSTTPRARRPAAPPPLRLNGRDARRLAPADVHARASAVFQGFARFPGASVRANVGVGFVPAMRAPGAVDAALALAGARELVARLPAGTKTRLEGDGGLGACAGADAFGCGGGVHGLSGGEWQRIAISRAFMRARRPEVELLVFDEPTSSLDAHAQKHVFDAIDAIARGPDGARTKTVVFITHRLATARRADKIAMMEGGTIIEYGTHEELLARDGRYAELYRAAV
ncbi:P-loop containing nucleoside triphosphate hydrolase protein [Epithele typhae]|uniref:P-loop containing nucleoside triphosphate hydrolase protein n=1 Tax=Epithele typhae TaxID=378194 RepID=UPI00200815A0|nr:P-loop containing nucleoside triphosphate hydrolase protein [Epithele typhae]KAH9943359.1 P-loop containing nucleoside triphosphate hydrolase protein [Epithele typhae]